MAWPGLDQRGFPRVRAKCDLWILGGAKDAVKAKTENMGEGGVCVILEQELEKFSTVRLRLTLPERSSPMECEGRVVWAVRSKDPGSHKARYDTGIEFVNLKPFDRDQIRTLVLVSP